MHSPTGWSPCAEAISVERPNVRIDATSRVDTTLLITIHLFIALLQFSHWQLGGLRVLRGVIHGFSEEARTRGFPSPSFGGFGFSGVLKNQLYVLLRMNTTETTYQRKSRDSCPLLGFLWRPGMSAILGQQRTFIVILPEGPLPRYSGRLNHQNSRF